MYIRDLHESDEIIAGDKTILRELLHPAKADLKLRYSLAHALVKPGHASQPHRLKTSEVYYILDGQGMIHINDETAAVRPGQAIYIPPNATQYLQNTGTAELKFLVIVDPAWRLEDEKILAGKTTPPRTTHLGVWVVLLAVCAGLIAKLPDLIGFDNLEFFYTRNVGFIVFPALAVYYALIQKTSLKIIATVLGIFAGAAAAINLLPDLDRSDTIILATLHLPLLLWVVTGVAFTGSWRKRFAWIEYLKFNGEMIIYGALLAIAGMVLTFLTLGLFSAVEIDIAEWYMQWVIIVGAAAAPVVGAHLVWLRSQSNARISPVLAKIFAPLFLITFIIYLAVILTQGKSPFTDREFLIVFNAMLIAVLAISVYSLTEGKAERRWNSSNMVALGLLATGLIIDAVALSAILFRLSSYGFTPNRIAVFGANVLIFLNTIGLLSALLQDIRKGDAKQRMINWLGGYLPVYAVWTAFITFIFPILFRWQ
ncbi:MAG: cupin domain-containing protein [Deltaproteobacteria bacterium]|nr:cupin domain-containing protein [Deltaproteobacteria bacterium]